MGKSNIDFQHEQAVDTFVSEWQLQLFQIKSSLDLLEQHFKWTRQQTNEPETRDRDSPDAKFFDAEVPLALDEARAALTFLKKFCVQS